MKLPFIILSLLIQQFVTGRNTESYCIEYNNQCHKAKSYCGKSGNLIIETNEFILHINNLVEGENKINNSNLSSQSNNDSPYCFIKGKNGTLYNCKITGVIEKIDDTISGLLTLGQTVYSNNLPEKIAITINNKIKAKNNQ